MYIYIYIKAAGKASHRLWTRVCQLYPARSGWITPKRLGTTGPLKEDQLRRLMTFLEHQGLPREESKRERNGWTFDELSWHHLTALQEIVCSSKVFSKMVIFFCWTMIKNHAGAIEMKAAHSSCDVFTVGKSTGMSMVLSKRIISTI